MRRAFGHMHALVEVEHLRNRISHQLRAWPLDAEMEQQLTAQFGSRAAVERQVTKRICYLVAMLALERAPEMLFDEGPRCSEHPEGILEGVAHVFADEIASLRRLIHTACCQVQGEANVQALTAYLVDTFLVGEPDW